MCGGARESNRGLLTEGSGSMVKEELGFYPEDSRKHLKDYSRGSVSP